MPGDEELKKWIEHGKSLGATEMIVVTDTFPNPEEQYPHFVIPGGEPFTLPALAVCGPTYDLTKELLDTIPPKPISTACCWPSPCGCG